MLYVHFKVCTFSNLIFFVRFLTACIATNKTELGLLDSCKFHVNNLKLLRICFVKNHKVINFLYCHLKKNKLAYELLQKPIIYIY